MSLESSEKDILISVAFATFDENLDFLKQSLESVATQSHGNWEIVFAVEPGDRNSDFFRQLAQDDPRIKPFFSTQRLGRTPGINKALSLATGDFIARLDSDDFCLPDRLANQLAFLRANPDVGIVGCNLLLVGDHGENLGTRTYPDTHQAILHRFVTSNGLPGPGVMMRREVLKQVGLFDERLDRAEDLEFWLRCFRSGVRAQNLPQSLLGYRSPIKQFDKRDKRHWKSNLLSRLRHSPHIWPIPKAVISISVALALYATPAFIHNLVFDRKLADAFRGVSY